MSYLEWIFDDPSILSLFLFLINSHFQICTSLDGEYRIPSHGAEIETTRMPLLLSFFCADHQLATYLPLLHALERTRKKRNKSNVG